MVPKGWKVVSGDEISIKITKGQSPRWQGFEYQDSGTLFVTSENVRDGSLDISNPKFLPLTFNEKLKGSQLVKGDILINIVGASIGRSCLFDIDVAAANINQAVCLLRVNQGVALNIYIHQYLQSSISINRLLGTQTESARPNLSLGDIRDFEFLLPPLPEQRKIAQILSTWDEAIATTERLLANKQQQKKALMQRLLTGKQRFAGFEGEWRKYSFSQIVTLGREKFDPKIEQETKLCIELEHIEQGNSRLIGSTTTANTASTKSHFCVGDILFGKLRPYLRKYWLADCSGVCSGEIWVFKADTSITIPEYIHQIIQLDSFIDITNVASGTHMPRADWSVVKDFIIHLPTIDEQRKISSLLSSFDRGTNIIVNQLDNLKLQKKALMQQLLTGKLRVKVDEAAA